jgi:hypothetical protein
MAAVFFMSSAGVILLAFVMSAFADVRLSFIGPVTEAGAPTAVKTDNDELIPETVLVRPPTAAFWSDAAVFASENDAGGAPIPIDVSIDVTDVIPTYI